MGIIHHTSTKASRELTPRAFQLTIHATWTDKDRRRRRRRKKKLYYKQKPNEREREREREREKKKERGLTSERLNGKIGARK